MTEVVVAGEHLSYDEAAGRAEWTGDVRLTAGSLLLTTEALVLTFDMDPVTGDQILKSLTAGPVVELTAEQREQDRNARLRRLAGAERAFLRGCFRG